MSATKNKIPQKFKLILNSVDSLQILLQELYDETSRNVVEIQREINRLAESTDLKEEIMDSKVKYAKAINDYSTNKNKALATKVDIAKLMTEILKFNGNTKKMIEESDNLPEDWNAFTSFIETQGPTPVAPSKDNVAVYKI